jgi:hypothetical protein
MHRLLSEVRAAYYPSVRVRMSIQHMIASGFLPHGISVDIWHVLTFCTHSFEYTGVTTMLLMSRQHCVCALPQRQPSSAFQGAYMDNVTSLRNLKSRTRLLRLTWHGTSSH